MWLALVALLIGNASATTLKELAGAYELVAAPAFDPGAAWPQGIENLRYVFDEEGRWYSLKPEQVLSKVSPIGRVHLADGKLVFHTPEGRLREHKFHLAPDALRIIHGEHSVWRYQRLRDPAAIEGPIEPKSLEQLEVDASAHAQGFAEVLSRSKLESQIADTKLHGVWELVRVSGVAIESRPDQGYYNDVLVASPKRFCFIQRAEQNTAVCIKVKQQGGTLTLDAGTEVANEMRYEWTAFGHLRLIDESAIQYFRKHADDPNKAEPVPLRIAVYRD
jgi:hypothetical protein